MGYKYKLKLVTIENPYKNIQNPIVQQAFGALMELRAEGYGPDYPKSYMPLDSNDYVAIQHIICEETNGQLVPLAGVRQVLLHVCDYYGLKMPILTLAEEARSLPHVAYLSEKFSKARSANTKLTYCSGAVIKKKMREDRDFSVLYRELIAGLFYLDYIEQSVDASICASVLRFKTNVWFEKLGYRPSTFKDKELSPIPNVHANNHMIMLMEKGAPSQWCTESYQRHKALYDSRILILDPERTLVYRDSEKKVAA